MSIFKNTHTGMCLSQGEFGHTLNNRDVVLRKCEQYNSVLSPSTTLRGDENSEYMILRNNGTKCLKPGVKNNKGEYEIELGDCDDTSYYKLYKDTRNINDQYTDKLSVYFIFSNNNSAYVNGTSRLWGKLLTFNNHKYAPNSSEDNSRHYYQLYDFEHQMKISDIITENKTIHCKIKYIIDEYDSENNPINVSTDYYLVPNSENTMLYFTSDSSESKRIFIETLSKSDYTTDELGREDDNSRNFNVCKLGFMIGNTKKYVKLDTRTNRAGMGVHQSGTIFRMMPKDNMDEFKNLFHYPNHDNTSVINISSYINPVKKIMVNNKNKIITRNRNDGSSHSKFLFNIKPKEQQTSTPLAEAYTGLTEGMTPRCEIKINGSCKNDELNITTGTYFLDSNYGGPEATNDYDCNVRAMQWKNDCNNDDVNYKFIQQSTSNGEAILEPKQEPNIIQTISDLYSSLSNDPTQFTSKINQINNILNSDMSKSYIGNQMAFSNGTRFNLENLKSIFIGLQILYNKVKVMKENIIKSFKTFLLDNMLQKSQSSLLMINIDEAKQVVSELNTYMSQLKSLQNDVNVSKEVKEAPLDLSSLNINLQFLYYIIRVLEYFYNKKDNIRSAVNTFYDYFNVINDGSFHIYNDNMNYLNITNSQISEDIFRVDSKTSITSLINAGAFYKDLPKSLFDIDFNDIYDMLFETTTNDIFQVNTTHMNKIIIPQFLNSSSSNINGGLFYYYIPLLQSQNVYYQLNSKCLSLMSSLNDVLNIPSNDNYVGIIKTYNTEISVVTSKLMNNTNLNEYSFFKILLYYGGLLNNGSSSSGVFVYCYGNLKHIQSNFNQHSGISYSNINHLEHYYRDNILLQKYNMQLINNFITKYGNAYKKALVDSNMIDGGNIQYINETPNVVEGFSSRLQNTKEGLQSMMNTTSNDLFSSTPQSMNLLHKSDYETKHVKYLNDAFLYRNNENDTYKSFTGYVNEALLKPIVNVDATGNAFMCDESKTPVIDITYTCNTDSGVKTTKYDSLYNNTSIFNECGKGACNMERILTLDTSGDIVTLIITDTNTNTQYSKKLYNLSQAGIDHSNLEDYDDTKSEKELNTVISDGTQSLPLIENITSTMSISDKNIGGKNALLSNNNKVKLILYKGKVYLQCIPLLNKSIKQRLYDATDEYILYSGNKVAVAHNNNFNNGGNNRPHSIYLYNIKDHQYKVGNNVNIHGYIAQDGVFYQTNNESTLKSHNNGVEEAFEIYTGMCLGNSTNLPPIITQSDIASSDEYVGYFKTSSGGTIYGITRDNMKYIYKCQNKSKTNNNADLTGSFYLKKFSVKSEQNACVSNPVGTDVITYDEYQTHYVDNVKAFVSSECGIEKVFRDNINKFKQQRGEFQNKFIKMIQAFNELSENELKMLKDTNINIEQLNKHVQDYDELYSKATNNKTIKVLVDSQKDDMSIAYKSSEYKMAVAGIASIGALIMMFNYMKK
jgi:hypothetical protein